ncbi:MAG: hypothetical protein M1836_007331 [Candelina mexicana]|nr:MAG: hypothetical protein M1836_007331 [Candelina mexicana]
MNPVSLQTLSSRINFYEVIALFHVLLEKDFLKLYLTRPVSNSDSSDDTKFWEYLDRMRIMHTDQTGFAHRQNRPDLRVQHILMGMMLGFVEVVVAKAMHEAVYLDTTKKAEGSRAFNKLRGIQNALFARHYVGDLDTGSVPRAVQLSELIVHAVYRLLHADVN